MTRVSATRRRADRETIVGLTPAQPGWRALSVGPERGDDWEEEVAAWALIADADDFRTVEGLIAGPLGLESAEDYEANFIRYLAPGQERRDFADDVAARQAELRERAARGSSPALNGHRAVPAGRAS